MKKNSFLKIAGCFAMLFLMIQAVSAQNGIGTSQPNKASLLDLSSSSKGVLIPRIALTSLTSFSPISGGAGFDSKTANSLLVYNTTTATGLTPGYYFWTESATQTGKWNRLQMSGDPNVTTLTGDVTGDPSNNTLSKLQGANYDVKNAQVGDIIVWDQATSTWIAKSPAVAATTANLTSTDFTLTPNGNNALLKALAIDIKAKSITTAKINTGSAANGQILVADGTGGITLGNVSVQSIQGNFPTVAKSGMLMSATSENIRSPTGASITLPPGKWMVFAGSTVNLRNAANGGGSIVANTYTFGPWITFYFSTAVIADNTLGVESTGEYVEPANEYSGRRAGGASIPYQGSSTFVNGVFSIENTGSTPVIYYLNYSAEIHYPDAFPGSRYVTDAFRDTNDANKVEEKYLYAVPIS